MDKKYIALSFDDGPSETTTGEILIKLMKYNIRASFFVVGDLITEDTEEIVRDTYEMGCEINNHSKSHQDMTEYTAEQIKEEITYTNDMVEKITGKVPKFFRPPYLKINDLMKENIDMTFIAGYACEDWLEEVSAEERARRILSQCEDGGIILMHDAEGNRKTVEALDILIPELLTKGYEFVTVSELFDMYDNLIGNNTKEMITNATGK